MSAQTFSSPPIPCWSHDVFLSFSGEHTRKTFIDHLYSALKQAGIHTFRDEDELPRGEHISSERINAIQGSRIYIVIFSNDYASSSWCLDELVETVRCKNALSHALIPIFFDVIPRDVRKQTQTFAEAFMSHEKRFHTEMERVQKWREALTEAANVSGLDLQNDANGFESKLIEKIVEEILCKVNQVCLHVAVHPVGMDSRVEEMKALLNIGTDGVRGVRVVGIYGIGGIGKTTIAKAVYNKICNGFEGSSCLLKIKEISQQPDGLIQLQEQLVSDFLKTKNVKAGNVDGGLNERFSHKRVLIVLDDVDQLNQFSALVGNLKWLAPGSRVIVTTRDEHLLTEIGVNEKYRVQELNPEESLQLFSWHAFRMAHPKDGFLQLSIDAVGYVGGIPHSLESLGSYLLGRSIIEWKSALEKLQKTPHLNIQKSTCKKL